MIIHEKIIFRYFSNVAVSYKDNGVITPTLNWGWSSPAFQMSTTTADLTKVIACASNILVAYRYIA